MGPPGADNLRDRCANWRFRVDRPAVQPNAAIPALGRLQHPGHKALGSATVPVCQQTNPAGAKILAF